MRFIWNFVVSGKWTQRIFMLVFSTVFIALVSGINFTTTWSALFKKNAVVIIWFPGDDWRQFGFRTLWIILYIKICVLCWIYLIRFWVIKIRKCEPFCPRKQATLSFFHSLNNAVNLLRTKPEKYSTTFHPIQFLNRLSNARSKESNYLNVPFCY